jgi:mono/diheme cytochrome c family protein
MNIRAGMFCVLLTGAGLLPGTASAADGATVFKDDCSSCHGAKGQGIADLAPALKGDDFVTAGTAAQVADTVKDGRAGKQKHFPGMMLSMPSWGGKLSDADIAAVVAFIRGDLQK